MRLGIAERRAVTFESIEQRNDLSEHVEIETLEFGKPSMEVREEPDLHDRHRTA